MARLYGLRLGLVVGALFSLTIAAAPTATAGYDDSPTASNAYGQIFIEIGNAYNEPMFALPVLENQRYAAHRDYPTFKPHADKQRLQLAAVRPSAVSGWRSGRVRALAFG